jgi:hypothetical protein
LSFYVSFSANKITIYDVFIIVLALIVGKQRKHFTLLGGSTVKEATRTILKRAVSHRVALQFNMTGQMGKRAFNDLLLLKVICG